MPDETADNTTPSGRLDSKMMGARLSRANRGFCLCCIQHIAGTRDFNFICMGDINGKPDKCDLCSDCEYPCYVVPPELNEAATAVKDTAIALTRVYRGSKRTERAEFNAAATNWLDAYDQWREAGNTETQLKTNGEFSPPSSRAATLADLEAMEERLNLRLDGIIGDLIGKCAFFYNLGALQNAPKKAGDPGAGWPGADD